MVGFVKTTLAVTGLLVASGAAQQWPGGFPECGVTCVSNMLTQTRELGCGKDDAKCFCANANFFYGVRDCSNQACGNQTAAGQVQDYGRAYCSQAGQPTPTVTTLNPTGGAGNGAGAGGATSSVAVTTSAIVSVVTNNGVATTTTIGSTTVFSLVGGGAGGAGGNPSGTTGTGAGASGNAGGSSTLTTVVTNTDGSVSTVTSAPVGTNTAVVTTAVSTVPQVTTITSGGSTFVQTTGTSIISSVSTSRPPNFAAQVTAAPGLLAAAGIVALLL